MALHAKFAATLLLLALLSGEGWSIATQTVPESGSIIAGFENDQNVTIFCEVFDTIGGNQQLTTWTLQFPNGSRDTITTDDPNFAFDGEPVPDVPGSIFDTNLTIMVLTVELNGATIFCGAIEEAANFSITVYYPPSRPLNLMVENAGSTCADFSWQPPEEDGNPPFSNYALVLNTTSGEERNFTLPSNETMTTTLDLLPGTNYEAFIVAISSLLSSEPSDPVNFTTNNTVPLFECTDTPTSDEGIINVTWNIVHTGGLELTEVLVEYRTNESGNYTLLPNGNLTDTLETFVLVRDFTAGQTFMFRVTAQNDLGSNITECPPFTLEVGRPTTPNMPISAGQPNTSDSIVLLLSTEVAGVLPIDIPHSFRFIVEVNLFNQSDNSTTFVEFVNRSFPSYVDGAQEQFLVDGLITEEQYQFRALAFNRFGTSEFSELSEPIMTQFTVPLIGPVSVITNDTNITVVWSYEDLGGLPLTEVIVEFRVVGSAFELAPSGNISDLNDTELSIPGQFFSAGEMYQFRVNASNIVGSSIGEESVEFEAQIGIPTIPCIPNITNIPTFGSAEFGTVDLELRTAAAGVINRPPRNFMFNVAVTQPNSNDNFTIQRTFPTYIDGQQVMFTVEDNLEAGESYQFACQAINEFGMSEFSQFTEPEMIPEDEDSEPPESSDDGLSTGAWVGIGIAIFILVVILLLAALVLLYFLIMFRKASKSKPTDEPDIVTKELQPNPSYQPADPTQETSFYEAVSDTPADVKPMYEPVQKEKDPQGQENLYDTLPPPSTDNPLYDSADRVTPVPSDVIVTDPGHTEPQGQHPVYTEVETQ